MGSRVQLPRDRFLFTFRWAALTLLLGTSGQGDILCAVIRDIALSAVRGDRFRAVSVISEGMLLV
jgi:hypothetical protein